MERARDARLPNAPGTRLQHDDHPATHEEPNDELEKTMTNFASTTQTEQPLDNVTTTNEHAEPLRLLMQNRNSTLDRRKKTPARR